MYVLPHTSKSGETMTSVSAGHIIRREIETERGRVMRNGERRREKGGDRNKDIKRETGKDTERERARERERERGGGAGENRGKGPENSAEPKTVCQL